MKSEPKVEFVKSIQYKNGVDNIYRVVMTEEERERQRMACARAGMRLIESGGEKRKREA